MDLQLSLSPRAVAVLVHRLASPRLTPVARAARRHEAEFRRLFMRAVREAQAAVPMGELEQALQIPGTGGPLYVLDDVVNMFLEETHLTVDVTPYMRAAEVRALTLADAYLRTLKAGAKAKSIPKVSMAFDETNPAAVEWAQLHAAKLVTDATREVKRAIRVLVVDGFENGVPPRQTAHLIRASIGLTERDAGAVMRRQLDMLAKGISPKSATDAAERYAAKLTRRRALTIARTETMKAANEGQMQLWGQAREAGLLTGRERKVWIVADPCPICAGLDGETVGLNESFSIGSDPPAHPNCRCTIGLVA